MERWLSKIRQKCCNLHWRWSFRSWSHETRVPARALPLVSWPIVTGYCLPFGHCKTRARTKQIYGLFSNSSIPWIGRFIEGFYPPQLKTHVGGQQVDVNLFVNLTIWNWLSGMWEGYPDWLKGQPCVEMGRAGRCISRALFVSFVAF